MVNNRALFMIATSQKDVDMDFLQQIALRNHFDVYVCVDEFLEEKSCTGCRTYDTHTKVHFLYVDDSISEQGYKNAACGVNRHIKKEVTAWDKAIMFAIRRTNDDFEPYEFVWFCEYDVLMANNKAIGDIDYKYRYHDLICRTNILNKGIDKTNENYWIDIVDKLNPPYYQSMACIIGVSKKLLNKVKEFVEEKKTLVFHEVMFNTLAMQNNMSVCLAHELYTITPRGDWGITDILLEPMNFFHPVKNIELHKKYREEIKKNYNGAKV